MTRWIAEHIEDGELTYRIGSNGAHGEELVAEWLGRLRLVARRDGSAFRFEPDAHASPQDIEKIRSGSAQLLLRHLRGHLALHGAAVAIDDRAVVLLGDSGEGKSTLAAYVCRRPGVTFLADDAVALETFESRAHVVPFERFHWLDAEARAFVFPSNQGAHNDDESAKAPFAAVVPSSNAVPLAALVRLRSVDESGGALGLHRVRGLDGLAVLMPQVVRFVIDDADFQRRELEALLHLLQDVPMFTLTRPRGFHELEAAGDRIVALTRDV